MRHERRVQAHARAEESDGPDEEDPSEGFY
jgi:hypothetical protein